MLDPFYQDRKAILEKEGYKGSILMFGSSGTTKDEVMASILIPQHFIIIPTTQDAFRCDGPFNLIGEKEYRRINGNIKKAIAACLNRTVFLNDTSTWNDNKTYYLKDRTNLYSKVLHDNAIDNVIYAFPYDDVYGADPTISWKLSDVKSINIKIDKLWLFS